MRVEYRFQIPLKQIVAVAGCSRRTVLYAINYLISEGDAVGQVNQGNSIPIHRKLAAGMLLSMHSDPEFFGLDKDGNYVKE